MIYTFLGQFPLFPYILYLTYLKTIVNWIHVAYYLFIILYRLKNLLNKPIYTLHLCFSWNVYVLHKKINLLNNNVVVDFPAIKSIFPLIYTRILNNTTQTKWELNKQIIAEFSLKWMSQLLKQLHLLSGKMWSSEITNLLLNS